MIDFSAAEALLDFGTRIKDPQRATEQLRGAVANSFGPWLAHLQELRLSDAGDFLLPRFEKKCPTGLGGTPPHLDFLVDGSTVVGVESKCLEPLTPPEVSFSSAYDSIRDERAATAWFRLVKQLRDGSRAFRFLDAAQLVKHALGLQRAYSGRPVVLLYLFWRPTNWEALEEYRRHATEVNEFAGAVRDERVRFAALSYPELWAEWEGMATSWVAAHTARLKERYQVEI